MYIKRNLGLKASLREVDAYTQKRPIDIKRHLHIHAQKRPTFMIDRCTHKTDLGLAGKHGSGECYIGLFCIYALTLRKVSFV